jgi:hypothetical protein
MTRENFQQLLTDLFNKYNPSKIGDIPFILEKYSGREFEAVKTLIFKYNFRVHPSYDPQAGTDKYVENLLKKYSDGSRPLDKIYTEEKKIEDANQIKSEILENLQSVLFNERKLLDEYLLAERKSLDEYLAEKLSKISDFDNKLSKLTFEEPANNKIELKLNLNYVDSDIELPKNIGEMSTGDRIITLTANGSPVFLEITGVVYDFLSIPGQYIKEITIDKI